MSTLMNDQVAVDEPLSLESINTIGDYLSAFGQDLIQRLDHDYQPVHHPDTDEPFKILNDFKRPLFDPQAHVVTALLKGFEKNKRQLLIGEMGVGKSSMSVGILFGLLHKLVGVAGRVIYMVPNHLIKKTKREVEVIMDSKLHEVHFLKSYKDVLDLHLSGKLEKKATKIEVYIIARDTAKLGYTYELVAKKVRRVYVKHKGTDHESLEVQFDGWVCPECGQQLMLEEEVPMGYSDFHNKHGKAVRRTRNLTCHAPIQVVSDVHYTENTDGDKERLVEFRTRKCGASLWQAKNKDKHNFSGLRVGVDGPAARKVSPAYLFKRYFKNKFDLLIGDECHELAGGSAQAHAFHVLMGCAKYTLAMTGSLSNGYSSSLFELFFRMFPDRLKKMGFKWGEVGKWIDLYGVREKTTKVKKNDLLNSTSNGSSAPKVSYKEMASIAPQVFTDFLSDVSCFIGLADMFDVLPEYKEGPINTPLEGTRKFVSCQTRIVKKPGKQRTRFHKGMRLVAPDWYLKRNLHRVESLLRNRVAKDIAQTGNSLLLGSLVNTTLSYPDVPFNFSGVYHPDTGECVVPDIYRLSERLIYPKEQQLIRFIRSQLKLNRRVCVYGVFTGKMGTLDRLHTLLTEKGIKSAILKSSVPGAEREAWIAERVREGIEVLLTHPALCATGLDLLSFPTMYFYQTGHRVNIVRQASRRHWRIGQSNSCLTVYNSYFGTMQDLALNLMAAKINTSMALEGKFSEDGLAALTDSSGGSIATQLARQFIGNKIEGVQSAESIWGKMTIDTASLMQAAEIETTPIPIPESEPALDLFSSVNFKEKEQDTKPRGVRKNIEIDLGQEGTITLQKGEWAAEWNEATCQYELVKLTSVSNSKQMINHRAKMYFAPAHYALNDKQKKAVVQWAIDHGNHLNQSMNWYMRTVWYHPERSVYLISMADASDPACREGEMILLSEGTLGDLKPYHLNTRFIEEGLIRVWEVGEVMYQWAKSGEKPYIYGVDNTGFADPLAVLKPASARSTLTSDKPQQRLEAPMKSVDRVFTYHADTLQHAILLWVKEKLPSDLQARYQEHISFIKENIEQGWPGLTVEHHTDGITLSWSPAAAPKSELEWRRWLYRLSCKQVQATPSPASLFSKNDKLVSSNLRTKKKFMVSEDQLAFNL